MLRLRVVCKDPAASKNRLVQLLHMVQHHC